MRSFYSQITRVSAQRFNVERAARLAAPQAELYGLPAERFAERAEARARRPALTLAFCSEQA